MPTNSSDQQSQQGAVERAPDLRNNAELSPLHIPGLIDEESRAILHDRGRRLTSNLVKNVGDESDDRESGKGRNSEK